MITSKLPCVSMSNINRRPLRNCSNNLVSRVKKQTCIKSKSTSNIEDLIIREDASNSTTNKTCSLSFMEMLEDKCVPFERVEYFQRVLRILELHYLYIEDATLRDKIPIDHGKGLYQHIDFESFTKSLFQSDEDKFFPCLIKNLITYMINTEGILADICVFNISIQKICSLLQSGECYLTEICLVLLKVVLKKDGSYSAGEKYQLMVRLNEVNDDLTNELNENEHVNSLSLESKLNLCMTFLQVLKKPCPDQLEFGDQRIGSWDDLSLNFWRFKSCESYLFIEKNKQDWLYVKQVDTIEKIHELVQFENQSIHDLLLSNDKVEDCLRTMTLDLNNNPVVKVPCMNQMNPENSIIFESEFFDKSETSELDHSVVTLESLREFDIESDMKKKQSSSHQSCLELDILMLIKKLLVANFINADITLNADHLIQSFGCGPVFESLDLKSVLDYREEVTAQKEASLDEPEQLEPIFGSTEWKNLSESLGRVDVSLADTLYLNLKIHNFKNLINLIFHSIPQRCFLKKFTKYKYQAWLNCVHNSHSKKNLRLLLFILDGNINWTESLEHVKCHICDMTSEVCDFYTAIKTPQQFIKEKCQGCGLVFHLNCYQANKCMLYGSKKIQKDYLKKDYQCDKCSEKNRVEYLVTDSVTVNNRTLRNTGSRKMNNYKLLNEEEKPKPKKRKYERKPKVKSSISDESSETNTIVLSQSLEDDELPLSQVKKCRV